MDAVAMSIMVRCFADVDLHLLKLEYSSKSSGIRKEVRIDELITSDKSHRIGNIHNEFKYTSPLHQLK